MANVVLILIGIIFIYFGVYNGIILKQHTFLKLSRTPRQKYFKNKPTKNYALFEGLGMVLLGVYFILIGL